MATKNLIEILEGGRLSPSYSNSIDFLNIEEQDAYWSNHKIISKEIQTPIQVYEEFPLPLVLSYPMRVAKKWNYMRVQVNMAGPNEPIKRKWFYYFITKVNYSNGSDVKLTLKLDVFQTYMFDFKWLESFVIREHQDRYDKNGDPIFNRMPEDIELGGDMVVSDIHPLGDRIHWYHIITKIALGVKSNFITDGTNFGPDYKANIGGLQQGFYHYIVPFDPVNPNKEWTCKYRGKKYTLESASHLTALLSGSEQTHTIRYLGVAPLAFTIDDEGSIIFNDTETFILNQPNNVNFVLPDEEGTVPKPGKFISIIFADTINGEISGIGTAVPETSYTVNVTPNPDYKLTRLYYNIEGGATGIEIDKKSLTFTLPNASSITIYAEFGLEHIAHAIKYVPETPNPTQFTRNGPTTGFEDDPIVITTFAKRGWQVKTRVNTTYTSNDNGISFNMPNNDVIVTSTVSEYRVFSLDYVIKPSEAEIINKQNEYDILDGISVTVQAKEGYQLLGSTWKTSGGTIVSGGTETTLNEDESGNILKARYELPSDACVPKNMYLYVLSAKKGEPKPDVPTEYNVDTLVSCKVGPNQYVPFNDVMGFYKVNPKVFVEGNVLTVEAYAYYIPDEITGESYVLGPIQVLRDDTKVEIPHIAIDIYDAVPGSPNRLYHYKARFKMQDTDAVVKIYYKKES